MIIEAPYKIGDTVSMKLSSGEEIIARLSSENDKSYTLSKPMMLAATQQGIGLAPFMFSVTPDTKITLNKTLVITVAKTMKEMADQYIQGTTGLQIAG
jgi:hypothetical protein